MNPNEFLETSERLAQGGTEGDWRSAISRAYYSVFHQFRNFFLAQGLDLGRGGQCHFNLYAALFNCGIPSFAPLGSRVDDLRVNRVAADYDLVTPADQAWAAATVAEARAVLADFLTLLQSIPPTQLVAGAHST